MAGWPSHDTLVDEMHSLALVMIPNDCEPAKAVEEILAPFDEDEGGELWDYYSIGGLWDGWPDGYNNSPRNVMTPADAIASGEMPAVLVWDSGVLEHWRCATFASEFRSRMSGHDGLVVVVDLHS